MRETEDYALLKHDQQGCVDHRSAVIPSSMAIHGFQCV